jgi:hypothetical protein
LREHALQDTRNLYLSLRGAGVQTTELQKLVEIIKIHEDELKKLQELKSKQKSQQTETKQVKQSEVKQTKQVNSQDIINQQELLKIKLMNDIVVFQGEIININNIIAAEIEKKKNIKITDDYSRIQQLSLDAYIEELNKIKKKKLQNITDAENTIKLLNPQKGGNINNYYVKYMKYKYKYMLLKSQMQK